MALFGLWRSKCPVDCREKAWIETRMRWLGEQFGFRRLTQCRVILPSEMQFLAGFDGAPESARRLFDLVCRCMEVNPAAVELRFEPPEAMSGASGFYEANVVHLAETQLAHPIALVAALARELARHVLSGRQPSDGGTEWQWTADLTPIVFGLGLFAVHAGTSAPHGRESRPRGVPVRLFGYALALHAWLCIERSADWERYLRHDAADAFRKGLQYLRSTEDALVRIDNLHNYNPRPSLMQLLEGLERGAPSESIAALWQLAERGEQSEAVVEAVAHLLSDRRPILRAESARALARLGPAAAAAAPKLIDALVDSDAEVRACAAYALGVLQARPETAVPALADCLDDHAIKGTAAWALARFGESAAAAMPRLLSVLQDALGRVDDAADYLAHAIRAISSSPETEFNQLIAACDPDLQQQIEGLLPEAGGEIPLPPGGQPWLYWPSRPT